MNYPHDIFLPMANPNTSTPPQISAQSAEESSARRAIVGILATADLLRRSLTKVVEGQDLTFQQFNILRILRGAGASGLPTLQIGERMVETTPGLTGLLDRLVVKELVERRRCAVDRRRVYCTISDKGLRILQELDEPVDQWEKSVVEGLSQGDLRVFLTLQAALRERLSAPES